MTFAIKGIDHVVLRVTDADRAMQFYCGVLGCHEERRVEDIGLYQLRAGACLIDIVSIDSELGRQGGAGPSSEGRNMDHFCLNIEPFDEAAIRSHLASHGIDPGELKTRYGATGDGPSFYIADPDGNTVELKGPPYPVGD